MAKTAPNWMKADLSPWDGDDGAKLHRADDTPVPCRICEIALRRLVLTQQWCIKCKRAFCPDHGRAVPGSPVSECVLHAFPN